MVFDDELTPGAAVQPREAPRAHGHRPHGGDPRHLRPERPQPGGQGAGRAGAAPLPPAAAARPWHATSASRAAASAPGVPARPSSRSIGGGSSAAIAQARGRPPRHRPPSRDPAQAQRRSRLSTGRHRRVHERGQVDAAQPTDRRGRARRGPPVRHARRHHPPARPARRRAGAASPTPSGSCASCPTSSSRRSARRSTSWSTPTCSCTSSTPPPPTPASRSTPSARCSAEIDAGDVPELLSFNKADPSRPRRARLAPAHPGSVAVSARTGERHRRAAAGHRRPAARRDHVVELVVPFDRGDVLAAVHREGEVLVEQAEAERHAPPGPTRRRPRRPGCASSSSRRPTVLVARSRPRVRPAALPLRPAGRAPGRRRRAHDGGAVDLSVGTPDRSAARRGRSRRWPSAATERAATRRRSARRRSARRPPGGCTAGSASTSTPRQLGGVRRHEGARGRRAAVAPPAHAVARHRPVPGGQLSHLRHGRDAGRLPGRARGRRRRFRLDLARSSRADAARALCLWVNTPGNPTGGLDDLGRGRRLGSRPRTSPCSATSATSSSRGTAPPQTILEAGLDGVLAVHSLSKRSNLAGARAGFYAGDPELVHVPARDPQARRVHGRRTGAGRGGGAWADDGHVDAQRARYRSRARAHGRGPRPLGSRRAPLPDGGVLPLGARPRRRRLGSHRAAGDRGRGAWPAPASSTDRPAPATSASRGAARRRIELVAEPTRRGLSRRSGCRQPRRPWVTMGR